MKWWFEGPVFWNGSNFCVTVVTDTGLTTIIEYPNDLSVRLITGVVSQKEVRKYCQEQAKIKFGPDAKHYVGPYEVPDEETK